MRPNELALGPALFPLLFAAIFVLVLVGVRQYDESSRMSADERQLVDSIIGEVGNLGSRLPSCEKKMTRANKLATVYHQLKAQKVPDGSCEEVVLQYCDAMLEAWYVRPHVAPSLRRLEESTRLLKEQCKKDAGTPAARYLAEAEAVIRQGSGLVVGEQWGQLAARVEALSNLSGNLPDGSSRDEVAHRIRKAKLEFGFRTLRLPGQ